MTKKNSSNTPKVNHAHSSAKGRYAEQIAAHCLSLHGYQELARNVRSRRGEIDIIARHKDAIVFVEVRSLSTRNAGCAQALASVQARKQRRLLHAARHFLAHQPTLPLDPVLRFDVVGIAFPSPHEIQYQIVQGAFSPEGA